MQVKNVKLTKDQFYQTRKQVLDSWPTGNSIKLDEAYQYLSSLPEHKYFSKILDDAKRNNKLLLQPRGGVATLRGQKTLLEGFIEAGADLMPVTIDSYTRQNEYLKSEKGLSESLSKKKLGFKWLPSS